MGRLRILLCLSFSFIISCNRPLSGDLSKISIEVPRRGVFGKAGVGSLDALPANRKACFGVSVTGPGIPLTDSNECGPQTGVLAGFVEPGQMIEASVPKGSDRTIALYVFLQDAGQNVPCPALVSNFSASQLLNTYLVATKSGVNLIDDVETVNITMNFPGLSQNLATQLSLPTTCTASNTASNPPGFGVTSARSIATGTGIKLHGRVGMAQDSPVLTGSGIRLYVRE